ncbi:MAG: HAMP domain-containing histidine kinase [Clostridia bacterium]|nr:HAMP domain-containing histidine kinase [Clostridia bacterium]
MKKRKIRNVGFSFAGAIAFFVLIAIIMQIAILVYDYICDRTDNVGMIAVLILILIVILSAFCTAFDFIRRKITIERPTKKILSATEKIASGDFSVNLNIEHSYDKYDHYDLIMENVNKMTAELKKTEILKVDFISNVSHEIKTPLAVIQNYCSLLTCDGVDEETRKSYAKTIISASKKITDLITNILKLNKLENQEIVDNKEVFNLTEALSESVIDFEPLIENKNITLSCDFDDVTAVSSKTLLELVWNNLISNAVKFTSDGGEISISLKKIGDDAEIKVSDTGVGISSEVGARIFEKFYQGDPSRSEQGNGLGLALVKKVIDVLGGEISVESELGKGSTFTVLLKGVVNER